MARVKRTTNYCDRCGKDVSTIVRGESLEKGLIHLSWFGRVDFINDYGAMLVSGEKKGSLELCHNCFSETENFLFNKKYTDEA